MKIKKLLIIILILLSTVPIVISHLLIYSKEKALLQNNIIIKLNEIATVQHKRIQQLLKSKKESVSLIASRTELSVLTKQFQKNNSAKSLSNILKILDEAKSSAISIKSLSVFSIQQKIIASTDLTAQMRPHVFNKISEEKQHSSNIQISRDKNDQLIIDFIKQLYINDQHIGYISVEFFNAELIKILSDYTGLGNTGEMVLAGKNNEGNIQFLTSIRHNKDVNFNIPLPKNKLDIITSAIKGESAILQNHFDYRSMPVLAISHHIPEVDWGMIVKIDHQEAFKQLGDLQNIFIALVVIFMALAVAVSLLVGKKLSEPLVTLEQVVLGIMKGDTSLRAETSKLTEVNRLGSSINEMVSAQLSTEVILHDAIKKLTDINKQINSEAERFKRWKESNFIGILHSDIKGNIIDANSTLLNMIGYKEADLLNGSIDWIKLTPQEFNHLDIAAIAEAEEKGFWTPFEKEYFHKNGRRVPILIGGSMFKYDTKEFIVFIIDLTDRNQQLDALSKYKRIIENSNDLIAYVDHNYQYKMINHTYFEYHGLTREQIENHNITEILGNEYFSKIAKPQIDQALAGSIIKFTATFDFKGVGEKLLNITYTPYKSDDGKVVGFIFWGEDITELEEQRRLTQSTKAEQELIINSMLEGVLTTDNKGVILTFNPEAENIFGFSQNEIIGNNVSRLIPSKHGFVHDAYLSDFLNGKSSRMVGNRQGRNVTALHNDNHEFPIRISIAQLPKNQFTKAKFIANFQDLTEIERQKELINRSLRMESLGKVAGGVAHDFNNILGIITGYCSLLLTKANSTDDNRYLSAIDAASNRGAKLTKSLLAFSKNQSTDITLLSINDIILTNKEMLETLLTSKISLQLVLAPELLLTCIDKNLFEDLLLNMSINAMHAMPNGGKLKIKTENTILSDDDKFDMPFQAGQYVKISIKDNGCGMNKEVCSHIFEPFYTTKENIGNGLGLSQCYGFVKSSKGVLTVDSLINKGSHFSIYLPVSIVKQQEKQLPIITSTDNDTFEAKNYTVLVVDDEEQILELNSEVLNDVGFNVFSFDNAEEALALLSRKHIDIIVTDVVMPKMGGVEFIRHAKALVPALKYLFVSGYVDEKNTAQAQDITPLLNKPYTRNEFITAIKAQCCNGDN